MNSKQLGDFGERIACYYLEKKGYKILDRNYSKEWSSVSKGEIDIVAGKGEAISFIEVKTSPAEGLGRESFSRSENSRPGACFSPEERVDFQKQRKLIKLAQNWLSEKEVPLESKWQIDVISIRVNLDTKKAKIQHFKNAIC